MIFIYTFGKIPAYMSIKGNELADEAKRRCGKLPLANHMHDELSYTT